MDDAALNLKRSDSVSDKDPEPRWDCAAVIKVAQPPFSRPRSRASSGDTSTKNAGWSSAKYGCHLLMPPAVKCSVRRHVVTTKGYTSAPASLPLG